MRGLKVFAGLFTASVSVIAATFLIPQTRSFYSGALWMSSTSYGSTPMGKLIFLSSVREKGPYMTEAELDEITQIAAADGRPEVLAIAVRSIARFAPLPKAKDSKAFSSPSPIRAKAIQCLQKLAESGGAKEPDNSFWPLIMTAVRYNQGRDAEAKAMLHKASLKPEWQDHAFFEADLRVKLAGAQWGPISGQFVSQQYASILLPYYSDFRNAGTLTINRQPIAQSVDDRIAVAGIGNQLAMQSENIIAIFVGSSLAQMSISERTDPKTHVSLQDIKGLSSREITTWYRAAAVSEVSQNFLQKRVFSNSDWNIVDDFRWILALFPALFTLLLIFPSAWIVRRFSSWREDARFQRAAPFFSAGLAGLFFCAAFAYTSGSQMAVPMGVCVVASALWGALAARLDNRATWPLLASFAVTFFSLASFNQDDGIAYIIGFNVAGLLPGLCYGVMKGSNRLQSAASWLAWAIWFGLIAVTVLNQPAIHYYAMNLNTPEPTLVKCLTLSIGMLLGAFGVGSFGLPGARNLWSQASIVQGLALTGFLAILAQCVSIDKAAAQLLPAEANLMAEFRERVNERFDQSRAVSPASLPSENNVE